MNVISHDALIARAEAVLNPHTVDGRLLGDVAATLVTEAVLSRTSSATLRDLLPDSEWPQSTGQPTVQHGTANPA